MISEQVLEDLYFVQKLSVPAIAKRLQCSEHKVNYWIKRFDLVKRTISEAIYLKNNPDGDPFAFRQPIGLEDHLLFGLGIGLYWGEGNKANKNTIRLGNSDPLLIRAFMRFLERFLGIHPSDLKFHIQVFSDIDTTEAKTYWMQELGISEKQFYKPLVTKSGRLGTYRKKSQYGVLTLYYGNVRAKELLMKELLDMAKGGI